MSALRDFIYEGPKHCGLSDINAKRWGEKYLDLFDKEISDKQSIFALQDGESIEDRLDILNGLYMAKGARRDKVAFYIGIIMLSAMSCAIAKGYTEYSGPMDRLKSVLKAQEPDNASMSALYGVEEASTKSMWG